MRNVARLTDGDRSDLFQNTANKMGINDAERLNVVFFKSLWYTVIGRRGADARFVCVECRVR